MSKVLNEGVLNALEPGTRYIVIHPKNMDKAKECLDRYISSQCETDVDYRVHQIKVGNDNLLALSSANKSFYFGRGENFALNEIGVTNIIAYRSREDSNLRRLMKKFRSVSGQSFMSSSVADIRRSASIFGITPPRAMRDMVRGFLGFGSKISGSPR